MNYTKDNSVKVTFSLLIGAQLNSVHLNVLLKDNKEYAYQLCFEQQHIKAHYANDQYIFTILVDEIESWLMLSPTTSKVGLNNFLNYLEENYLGELEKISYYRDLKNNL